MGGPVGVRAPRASARARASGWVGWVGVLAVAMGMEGALQPLERWAALQHHRGGWQGNARAQAAGGVAVAIAARAGRCRSCSARPACWRCDGWGWAAGFWDAARLGVGKAACQRARAEVHTLSPSGEVVTP